MRAKTLDMESEQGAILARIVNAQEKVQARLLRVSRLFARAGIRYAIVGGHAVGVWVATKDESLVRTTRDVDVLVQPQDLARVREVLEADGFVYRRNAEMDMFLDSAESKDRDAVHLIYSGQFVRSDHALPAPELDDARIGTEFSVLPLEALVRTKLVAWRRKDQVHLLDLIGVGLIDCTWPEHFGEPLRARLQELLDNPE